MNGGRMSKDLGCNRFPRNSIGVWRAAALTYWRSRKRKPEAVTGAEAVIEGLVDEGHTTCSLHDTLKLQGWGIRRYRWRRFMRSSGDYAETLCNESSVPATTIPRRSVNPELAEQPANR
jgi:hypothetical protein